jgi:hypothetical protein
VCGGKKHAAVIEGAMDDSDGGDVSSEVELGQEGSRLGKGFGFKGAGTKGMLCAEQAGRVGVWRRDGREGGRMHKWPPAAKNSASICGRLALGHPTAVGGKFLGWLLQRSLALDFAGVLVELLLLLLLLLLGLLGLLQIARLGRENHQDSIGCGDDGGELGGKELGHGRLGLLVLSHGLGLGLGLLLCVGGGDRSLGFRRRTVTRAKRVDKDETERRRLLEDLLGAESKATKRLVRGPE